MNCSRSHHIYSPEVTVAWDQTRKAPRKSKVTCQTIETLLILRSVCQTQHKYCLGHGYHCKPINIGGYSIWRILTLGHFDCYLNWLSLVMSQ